MKRKQLFSAAGNSEQIRALLVGGDSQTQKLHNQFEKTLKFTQKLERNS